MPAVGITDGLPPCVPDHRADVDFYAMAIYVAEVEYRPTLSVNIVSQFQSSTFCQN